MKADGTIVHMSNLLYHCVSQPSIETSEKDRRHRLSLHTESMDKNTAPQPVSDGEQTRGFQAVRAALLMLILLATAAGAAFWERLRDLPHHLEIVPLLLFVVICIFAFLVYVKAREMAELRGAVQGLQDQQSALTSELETQKLLQTVAASRESFRDLVDSFEAAVFTLSLDGKVRAANKAFVGVLQRTFYEVIGRSIFELIAQPTERQLQAALPTFLEKRQWSGLVRVLIATTDQWKYFDCTLHPVLQDDSVLAITIIANDVTAEHERETMFTALFETLHEPVWIATSEGRVLDLNHGLAALLGLNHKEQLVGDNLLDVVLEPERQMMRTAMNSRLPVTDLELTLARTDGSRAFCIANATPVTEVSGAVRYHGTFTDITQRRTMERQLACEQKLREQLIASFPDAIVTVDADGRITFVSGRAERMFGKASSSLLSTSLIDQIDPQDEMGAHLFLQDCFSSPGTVCTQELHLRCSANGIWRIAQVTGTALQDDKNQVLGVVASLRDVTNHKEIERQLIARERMAAMGQMIEGFAHELNNPLTAIIGASALMKDVSAPSQLKKNLELLEGQAARAREIVQNLLLFARPAAAGFSTINLRDLVDRTVALRRYSLRSKNIAIDLQGDDAIPNTIGDPPQLMQVFLNLLINAEMMLAVSEKNKGTIRIRIGATDDLVWCTFQDDGASTQSEYGARIFEHFSSGKRSLDNADLGLNLCQAIVHEHAGNIEVSPADDGSLIFHVSLPILTEASVTAQ